MENSISKGLRITFLVHAIFSAIFGLGLYVIPGRVLIWLGWVPATYDFAVGSTRVTAQGSILVDPVLIRVLGAALLALALASFLGWRARQRQEVSILVPLEFVFCILSVVAFLYILVRYGSPYGPFIPVIAWVLIVILLGFTVAWGIRLRR